MATITGLTAERMLEIEASSVVDARVEGGELILIKHDGTEMNVGSVAGPPGPAGPTGPAAVSAIPGEMRLWPGDVLPALATYGKWVWADGQDYLVADHPLAAAHISALWKTMYGLTTDPGATRFRVPDMRGVTPAGLDQMPSPSTRGRANRLTRAVAIQLARVTGKETHVLHITEMAKHRHGTTVSVNVSGGISGTATDAGAHQHLHRANYITTGRADGGSNMLTGIAPPAGGNVSQLTDSAGSHTHPVNGSFSGSGSGTIAEDGGDVGHETVQPTVMVPYIVYLDVV